MIVVLIVHENGDTDLIHFMREIICTSNDILV